MKASSGKDNPRSAKRRTTVLKLMMSLLVALLLLPLAAQGAQAAPNDVMLASSDAGGLEGDALSDYPAISADGRYVVFRSSATNLVPGVTGIQIYRKDLMTDEVRLVSESAGRVQGDNSSADARISADGRYVVFLSSSSNLVTPATTFKQIYRKDMLTGEVLLASSRVNGTEGNNESEFPGMSLDGRYVSFASSATDLITPNTTGKQVFRKDLATGQVILASESAAKVQGNGTTIYNTAVSSDGRYVAFDSTSTNLKPGVTSGLQQLYRKDIESGAIALVSATAGGAPANLNNGYASFSCDGRYVAFASNSDNLVPAGTTWTQIFRKDMESEAIVLVSAKASGAQGDGSCLYSSISADGRYVAFDSHSTDLVTPNTNFQQVFRKDLVTKEVTLVSADATGVEGNDISAFPSITPDGRYVAFYSNSTDLVTPNTNSQQVFRKELDAPYYFYFAEGYTGPGFQEYLCLGNPGGSALNVGVTYLFRDGTTQNATYNIPANSRFTVDVNAVVGADREVSVKCEASRSFVAERPMYFAYQDQWMGGHDVVGAPSPACAWYFAEGYTGAGFDEWVCVLNPGDLPVDLTFRFQTQEEGEKVVTGHVVGPNTRASFKVNDLLGGGSYQTSLKLESDHPIVAERPMYFSYSGTGGWGWTGGHCVMGASSLANDYFFAEGTTRLGFEEWLTIQNPGDAQINVHATYNLGAGTPVETDIPVDAGRRTTVFVPYHIGMEQDASVRLSSDDYFLAERPMYFDYQGLGSWGWPGGHCVIGATSASENWFFAEGYTGTGFEEWLCIQNPGPGTANVIITYYPEGGAPIVKPAFPVPAGTRFTVPVNADAGPGLAISAELTANRPIIVERPMYFNFRGMYPGGHDVVGFAP